LDEAGFEKSRVGIAMRDLGRPPDDLPAAKDTHAQAGALTGAVAGLGLGALTGYGVLAGVGPVLGAAVCAGPLGVILSNAAAGAGIGGLGGFLVGAGIPEHEAKFYQAEFDAGNAIVTVHAGSRATEATDILHRHGAYDVDNRKPDAASAKSSSASSGHD